MYVCMCEVEEHLRAARYASPSGLSGLNLLVYAALSYRLCGLKLVVYAG
jgi:hypothetical protein